MPNPFKIKNKDGVIDVVLVSLLLIFDRLTHSSGNYIVGFEQVNADWDGNIIRMIQV